ATLAAGDFPVPGTVPIPIHDFHTYRLSDVRAGDRVSIFYNQRINGVETCNAICIRRRPGGLVPPAPGEDQTRLRRWHDEMNRAEARARVEEELGVPPDGRPPPVRVCKG